MQNASSRVWFSIVNADSVKLILKSAELGRSNVPLSTNYAYKAGIVAESLVVIEIFIAANARRRCLRLDQYIGSSRKVTSTINIHNQ